MGGQGQYNVWMIRSGTQPQISAQIITLLCARPPAIKTKSHFKHYQEFSRVKSCNHECTNIVFKGRL